MAASKITTGSWSARWGEWVVGLRGNASHWRATVWRWTTAGGYTERTQLGACEGFTAPADAVSWACDVLRDSGAKVFVVDKPSLKLETLLRFSPAPEAVA